MVKLVYFLVLLSSQSKTPNAILALDKYFTPFKASINGLEVPTKFTYPFFYDPNPLSVIAAEELQAYIQNEMDWDHDFGLDADSDSGAGKMFGVLVVQNKEGELGYLSSFSGKIANSNLHLGFVPPVFDMLDPNGFFVRDMDELSEINRVTAELLSNPEVDIRKKFADECITQSKIEIEAHREAMRVAKADRKMRRMEGDIEMTGDAFKVLEKELSKESLMYKHQLKTLTENWKDKIDEAQSSLSEVMRKINFLKKDRKKKSNNLQQKLFSQYDFLNQKGKLKNVVTIFKNTAIKVPPSAAGECAAPKLLQFAYQNNLKPIAMAEFWWGRAPKSEIRKHGFFYPSCRGKCEPILNHMLVGLDVEDNPLLIIPLGLKTPEIIFEDDDILVINKPEGMLSVRGKTDLPSVQDWADRKYPKSEGPMIIHRLDMATSGILILSKTKKANKEVQAQFIQRTIKKRYVAILEGIIKEDEGIIDLPMRQDFNDRPKQLVCHEDGKPAKTRFKVVERVNNTTKVHLYPITGRSHQLRVHTAHTDGLGCPIVGDDLYGTKGVRLHLHAEYIEFDHPISKKPLKLKVKAEF
tara:strand:+ start:3678 stop:5420 length:1743 start_codon:yes stop_codon:yes gene_type:complete